MKHLEETECYPPLRSQRAATPGEWSVDCKGHEGALWVAGYAIYLNLAVVTWMHTYVRIHQAVHLR